MYNKYLEWAQTEGIEIPAKANKFGVAVARLFNNPDVRQHDTAIAKKQYFYEGLQVITAEIRQDFCQRFTLPQHVQAETEAGVLKMHYITPVFFDHELLEFSVAYNLNNGKYNVVVRGVQLNNEKIGLTSYADLDQVFVDGMDKVFSSMYFCRGLVMKVTEKGKKSKIPEQHIIGYLGGSGVEEKSIKRCFSRNCKVVLSITRELGNHTCGRCVHDLARFKEDDGLGSYANGAHADSTGSVGDTSREQQQTDNSEKSDSSDEESNSQDEVGGLYLLKSCYFLFLSLCMQTRLHSVLFIEFKFCFSDKCTVKTYRCRP